MLVMEIAMERMLTGMQKITAINRTQLNEIASMQGSLAAGERDNTSLKQPRRGISVSE